MRVGSAIAGGCAVLFTLMTLPSLAYGQDSTTYVFFAPGDQREPVKKQIYEAGFGLERKLDERVAVQADVAALPYYDTDDTRTVAALASVGGAYHFTPGRTLDPFVLAGYSLQFRDYTANMFHYGVGLRYWFREERALLVEVRDHVGREGAPVERYWSVRIGLVFR